MYRYISGIVVLSMLWSGTALGAGVSRETAERIRQLGDIAATMAKGKSAEYAKDLLDVAQATITAAQAAITAGNEKEALQKAELADLQLKVADAKGAEKDLSEQVAVRRSELKKLEAQLERYRQGEEN
ncbi:MAG: hypothetical protein A2X79_04710 [Desulfuromonadaceae bacterium GWB2_53_15]|nr:MAG: hypothetical protein A2X83_05600 [Desulfuromonadales bacterium GWD2_54_10]OHB24554.1 MAG: hypothetical protein A2X79_04710 [Desulfuromonadaceae bacterium GWB2_53_15]